MWEPIKRAIIRGSATVYWERLTVSSHVSFLNIFPKSKLLNVKVLQFNANSFTLCTSVYSDNCDLVTLSYSATTSDLLTSVLLTFPFISHNFVLIISSLPLSFCLPVSLFLYLSISLLFTCLSLPIPLCLFPHHSCSPFPPLSLSLSA